jgi:creatinine amidohydrolase/Fe(II)-dependent formamide hydrolase-like protein
MHFFICALLGFTLVAGHATGAVFDGAKITTTEFAALDRGRTVVVIPGGILEEHGPYLPSNTDGLLATWLAKQLSEKIAERPGWSVLLLPEITLGHSGANDIGQRFTFPGSITVRAATLRSVYMDLADALREHGFRWVFLVHIHGAPLHNQALDEASDYFTDTSGGRMVHLMGLSAMEDCCSWKTDANPQAVAEDGFTVHAGVSESSRVMFVAPETVKPEIAQAPSITGKDFADLVRIAEEKEWPGYFGAPRFASKEIGERVMRLQADKLHEMATAILEGKPWPQERFFVESTMDPADVKISRATEAFDAAIEKRQKEWRARGKKKR